MTAFEILEQLALLNWDVIATGRMRGWITDADLSSFAAREADPSLPYEMLTAILELENAEQLSAEVIDQFLFQLSPKPIDQRSTELDVLRLAKLIELKTQDIEWEDLVTRLEELRSDFGYPEDMHGCSRYGAGPSDPLVEMKSVIERLKSRFCVGRP
ncbi:MAG: DUF2247 family protein [Planctomycetota bacterium]